MLYNLILQFDSLADYISIIILNLINNLFSRKIITHDFLIVKQALRRFNVKDWSSSYTPYKMEYTKTIYCISIKIAEIEKLNLAY